MFIPLQRLLDMGLSEDEALKISRVHVNTREEELSDDAILNIVSIVKKLSAID